MRIQTGETFPDFTVNTGTKTGVRLSELTEKKSILWVIRYIGCTVCRYDVHVLAENYERIREKGYDLFVVMQSDQEHIQRDLKDAEIPFEIICDNKQEIYQTLDIFPANSKEELAGENREKLMAKGAKARELGFSHGDYEGNELQLPALFILDEKRQVTYAHYGKNITDMPSVDELVEML